MAQGILVFIEQRDGQIRKASLEALSEASRQAAKWGEAATAVLVGDNVKALAEQLGHRKVSKIFVAQNPELKTYSTEGYCAALSEVVKKVDPRFVFAAHSSMAKDLIPRVAARLDAPCVSDAMEIRSGDKTIEIVKPMYAGKCYGVFDFSAPLGFVTLRPNVFPVEEPNGANGAAVEEVAVNVGEIRAKVVEVHAAEGQKVELSEASIIVSGGRGIKGPENWGMLQSLCDVLGAALGASRAVVDAGWIDHQHQVGQTGKTVSPQLYIAVGISGAIQHLAGMSSSKVIVAINKDPDAPIFKHATYGLVGDVFEIVPKLTEEFKKALNN